MKLPVVLILVALADACQKPALQNRPFGKCPVLNGPNPTYLMDVKDRSVFYECDWGTPMRQQCPSGLVFNPRLKVCDYPSQTCEPYGPVGKCHLLPFPLLRDGANVSVFYFCIDGKPYKLACRKGKVFNARRNTCAKFL